MEGLSRKLASNDRVLENINNRMDNLFSATKNQHSFNKMIESQIAQLAATVPLTDKGKILGQPEDLENANLINIHNATYYCIQPSMGRLILPEKKSDPGRPVIPIAIGPHIFQEAICDFKASGNIIPKVIYDKINGDTLLYTNMHLQLVDQSLYYPKGVLEDAIVRVRQSYVPVDFVVLETGGDEKGTHHLGPTFPEHHKSHHLRG
jgi:hypothetical protein